MLEISRQGADVWGNIYRNIMWGIAKGVLWLLDGFFGIIDTIWRYRFFDNEYVNKIFGGAIIVACSWLILKVIIELILNHIVKNDNKGSPLTIYRGVVLAIVMMFLITPLFDFGHKMSTSMTDAVITVSGMGGNNTNAEGTISKAIIRSMVYDNEMYEKDITDLVDNWKTIDITKSEGGFVGIGDEYVYSLNLFMLIVLSIVTIFLLFFVAIQMAKRVMEIALFKIIGPFCCTSLTNGQSRAFETWAKSTMGLFLITVVQFVSLGLLMNMFGSAIKDNGTLAGIFLIIGALLFIISTPTIISSLLGQQSGIMTAFGDMQSLMALGHGIQAGLSVATNGVQSAVNVVTGGKFGGSKSSNNSNGDNSGASSNEGSSGSGSNSINDKFNNNNNDSSGAKDPFKTNNSNPYSNPHNVQFNPVREKYVSEGSTSFGASNTAGFNSVNGAEAGGAEAGASGGMVV